MKGKFGKAMRKNLPFKLNVVFKFPEKIVHVVFKFSSEFVHVFLQISFYICTFSLQTFLYFVHLFPKCAFNLHIVFPNLPVYTLYAGHFSPNFPLPFLKSSQIPLEICA